MDVNSVAIEKGGIIVLVLGKEAAAGVHSLLLFKGAGSLTGKTSGEGKRVAGTKWTSVITGRDCCIDPFIQGSECRARRRDWLGNQSGAWLRSLTKV